MNERKTFQKYKNLKIYKNRKNIKSSFKTNKGITLIALVISIIVMLILAGVSLNAVIGDNGIITQAQNATYMQSVAVLEEFLNEYYISHFDSLPQDVDNKVEALQANSESSSWFWMPKNYGFGGLNYVVTADGQMCYFIDKEAFENNSNSNISLKGGDAGDKTYQDYASFNDVYGVTSDLKVYYCSSGKDSILGMDSAEIDLDDPNREVFPAGSAFANLINGGEKVTAEDVKKVTALEINGSSGVQLTDLYNLSSLKKLTLTDYEASLEGIQNAVQLTEIMLKNCTISDYSALSNLGSKLNKLYLYCIDDNELTKFCTDLANAEFGNLEYFGVVGNISYLSEVNYSNGSYSTTKSSKTITTTLPLSNLSDTTKKAIKFMNLQNNNITTLEGITDYSNVYLLRAEDNKLDTLKGIQNMNGLKYLYAPNNNLGINENTEKNEEADALSFINNSAKLYLACLQNNKIIWIDYLKNQNELTFLTLSGNSRFDLASVTSIADIYLKIQVSSKSIDIKYLEYLTTSSNFSYKNLAIADTEKITYLKNLDQTQKDLVQYMDLSGSAISNEDLNEILKDYNNLVELNLNNCTNLTSFNFLQGKTKLRQILFNNTGIVGDEVSKLDTYATAVTSFMCNNPKIDLTKMQKTISRTSCYSGKAGYTTYCGAGLQNTELKKQLENCTEITYITTNGMYEDDITLDLSNTKLTSIYFQSGHCSIILPSTINTIQAFYMDSEKTILDFRNLIGKTLEKVPFGHLGRLDFNTTYKTILDQLKNYNITVNNLILDLRAKEYISEDIISAMKDVNIKNIDFGGGTSQETFNFVASSWTNKLKNVTSITMRGINLQNLDFLSENTNLTSLSLIDCHISDISGISNCTKLESLDLSGTTNGFSSLQALENMNKLTTLNLNNCNGIYDTYGDVKNLEILAKLHKTGNLNTLKFTGNSSIIDWSPLTNLGWNKDTGNFPK